VGPPLTLIKEIVIGQKMLTYLVFWLFVDKVCVQVPSKSFVGEGFFETWIKIVEALLGMKHKLRLKK